jgi:UDP-N-acetylglucosamine 4,6-dehydratase
MNGVGLVVHAAALKRIEVGHYNPVEMVKTNVDGAINVIEAAQDAAVKRVVALSTDKAWQPVSPYGYSKAMAEALFLAANGTVAKDGPGFGVCRYGNIWNSNGSVVPRWRAMLAAGAKTVPVTDPNCTRFFMLASEAVDLVLSTQPGEMNIPTLPAYRIGDLAEAMGAEMEVVGLPAWEKRHEGMTDGNTSDVARRMTIDELKEALDGH